MKRTGLAVMMIALTGLLLSLPGKTQSDPRQRMKNFVLVVDQSNEMNVTYHGRSKQLIAREIARKFIDNVPEEFDIVGAMYMYGITAADRKNMALRVQNFAPFNKQLFTDSTRKMSGQHGPSSLSVALRDVRKDMEDKVEGGRTAVIIISGGHLTDLSSDAAEDEAKKLKKKFKDDVCIYTVLVGNSRRGGQRLRDLQKIGKCGIRATSDTLDSDAGMKRFVNHIFYRQDAQELDSDMDGVPDSRDECPGTPFGATVDHRGCWVVHDINFDTGKHDIKPMYYKLLDSIAAIMNMNPELVITIEGHTDSVGDPGYNQQLSERRASAVKDYLVNQGGVNPDNLVAVGRGQTQPIADNATAAGRAQNRRIEFVVPGQGVSYED